jgi:hypothetical protein
VRANQERVVADLVKFAVQCVHANCELKQGIEVILDAFIPAGC